MVGTSGFWQTGIGDENEVVTGAPTGFGSPIPMGLFSTEDEYLTRMYGVEKFLKYRQMGKSNGAVAAILRAYMLPIVQADWDVKGGDPEILEFVRPMIMRDIKSHLRQVLKFPQYGMYAFEQTFEVREGRTVETGIYPRPPWTYWGIVEDNKRKLARILQLYGATWGYIPANRMVLFVFDPDGESYQGSSLLRPCLQHFDIVTELYKVDAIGNNRHAVGALDIGMSDDASEADIATMNDFGEQWQTNESGHIVYRSSKVTKLGIVFNGYRNDPLMASVTHHNQMMFSSALASFLGIGSQNTGSLAREGAEINFFVDGVCAIADLIAEVETNTRIKRIVDLNFSNVKEYPELCHSGVKRLAVDKLGAFIQSVTPFLSYDVAMENHLREKIGAPLVVANDRTPGTEREHGEDDSGDVEVQLGVKKMSGAFWRDRTGPEKFVRLKAIDKAMDDRRVMVENRMKDVRAAQVEQLVNASRGIVKRKEIAGIASLRPRKQDDYKSAIMRDYSRDWTFGYSELVGELNRQAKGEPVVEEIQEERVQLAAEIAPVSEQLKLPIVERKRRAQDAIANGKAQDYSEDVSNTVLRDFRNALRDGMTDDGLSDEEIIARAEEAAKDSGNRAIASASSFAASSPIQYGRTVAAQANADVIAEGFYSAILDGATCSTCRSDDGKALSIENPQPPRRTRNATARLTSAGVFTYGYWKRT